MAFTYQATGDETEVYDENDDAATPVLLVPFLESETPDQHQDRVKWIVDAMNGAGKTKIINDSTRIKEIRKCALRAIAANRIVAATNVSDLEDDGSIFEAIHDKANDLTIDTQRTLARSIGWLVDRDDMAEGISTVGADLLDQLTHGVASDHDIMCAYADGTGEDLKLAIEVPGSLIVVRCEKGFVTLHEPDEDGNAGDVIASVWRDDWLLSLQAARPPVRS